MLTIVGGTYREVCLEPRWDEWYGSGLRAAAAVVDILKERGDAPRLCSWVSSAEREDVLLKCETLGIQPQFHERNDSIEFQYDHGLASPRLFPDTIVRIADASLQVDNALVFGIVEVGEEVDRVQVTGDRIVYDPQAEAKSIPWGRTKGSAKRLAIVANLNEARAMAQTLGIEGESTLPLPQRLGRALLIAEGAEVVIVKNGAEGAFVVTKDDIQHVCSYKTASVFPFGSGDVFSAVFSALWCELQADPVLAAERASIAAACHSGAPVLPIPPDLEKLRATLVPHSMRQLGPEERRPTIYLAGPLFNFPQRWFLGEIRRRLSEQGVRVFSPYHDVGVGKDVHDIVREDLEGLHKSKLVFAVLDGLDAGTLFEIGYAVAKGIPVVGFRQCAGDSDLTMLLGHEGCEVYSDFPTAIYHAAWKALEV